MNDSVSLLILAHNKAEYTERCLTSLFSSTLRPFQVVLVENGSTDHTQQVMEHFVKRSKDEQIEARVLTLPKRR